MKTKSLPFYESNTVFELKLEEFIVEFEIKAKISTRAGESFDKFSVWCLAGRVVTMDLAKVRKI